MLPDEEARQRARLLVAFSICLTPAGGIFTLGYFLLGDISRAILIGVFTLWSMGAYPVLHQKGLDWAIHWWYSVFFSALVFFGAYNGTASASPAWMGLLLVLVTLVGGIRAGLLWSVPSVVAILVLNVLQHQGTIPLVAPDAQTAMVSDAVGYLLFFAACAGLGIIFELTKNHAFQQLAEARDAAHDASEAKSRFLATMSHEIRTPMNGILGLTELLQETPLSAEQQELTDTLRSSSRALVDIISDILDFSKIEAGRMELERLPLAPHLLLLDVVALFTPAAERKGLSLRAEIAPDVPDWLWSDPTRLRQILTNLISNAVKFTAAGEIVVRAGLDGPSRWRLEVVDTGPGVSAAQQGVLFEPFTQAESSTTRRFGGTGLGLAICSTITELMGGEIGVESDGATGSCFWVRLPCEPVPQDAEPTETAPEEALHLSGRVLLVEDNAINQLVASRLLAQLGLSAHIVSDGEAALAALGAEPFSLVLMDCQMPKMDGYAATRAARQAGHALPIIALTADSTEQARSDALAAGMDDYLSKPITLSKLRSTLGLHLSAGPLR